MMSHIEIVQGAFRKKARIAGTAITVEEIVSMHLHNDTPIDWIVENYESLSYAQVYAALFYYYDHQEEIEAGIAESARLISENATPLDDLLPGFSDTPA